LLKDRGTLLTFDDFPAEHGASLKTTNPIESMLATVKLRTYKSKGCGSRETYLSMLFKLTRQAQDRRRRLNAPHLVQHVAARVTFVNGEAAVMPNDGQMLKRRKRSPRRKTLRHGRRLGFP
jgi:transposase-like protein